MRDFLYVLDGPAKHSVKEVRRDATTMATFRYLNGDWGLYDRSRGFVDSIRLHETGAFVASQTEVIRGVTETDRYRYEGVL